MSPTSTVGPERLPGKKKKKERLSYLACTNADGSEKFLMLIIGRSKKQEVLVISLLLILDLITVQIQKHE